jgi:Secretion system C-terminal sorting domain
MKKSLLQILTCTVAVIASLTIKAQPITCFGCGTGSNGAFNATSNTTLVGGTYDYTTFNINSGVTVTVTGTQPLIITCSSLVTINGILSATGANGTNGITYVGAGVGGAGVAGGQNGGNGIYSTSQGPLNGTNGSGAGGATTAGAGWCGGGGAGYSAIGSSSGGSSGGFGGPIYGDAQLSVVLGGSGGGGGSGGFSCGSGGGGGGGGYVKISSCQGITIGSTGGIRCNGGDGGSDGTGNCGGGGAGSGGTVWIGAPTVINNGQVHALGGLGGASTIPNSPYFGTGANGAQGRIRIDGNLSGTGNTIPATFFSGIGMSVAFTTSNPSICLLDSITLSPTITGGTGPYTYLWQPGNSTLPSIDVSPLNTQTYTVNVTDAAGCLLSTTITVTVNQGPGFFITGDATICPGQTCAFASNMSVNLTSQWYLNGNILSGETNPNLVVNSSGTYSLVQTTLQGCSDSSDWVVLQGTNPVVNLGNDTTFCSGSLTLDAQNVANGNTYLWSDNSTTQTMNISTSGQYAVQVATNFGCFGHDTINITISGLPTVTVSSPLDTACLNTGAITLSASPSGGTFSGPGVSGNTFSASVAGMGTHTVYYTFTDMNGCSNMDSLTIFVDPCLTVLNNEEIQFLISPNPSNGIFNIQSNTNGMIEIFDLTGKKISSQQIRSGNRDQLNLSGQASGIYFLRMTTETGSYQTRIIIQ